ncbi:MAG: hypothetical protein GY861_02850 [bacterium]|nr:hypothetical protein [bacterium]
MQFWRKKMETEEQVEVQGDFAEINQEVPEQGEQPDVTLKVEERARLQGWVPKDEFRGDVERHISAQEFVDRADHMMPILKSVNQKYEGTIKEQGEQLDTMRKTMDNMVRIQEKYSDDKYKEQITDITNKQREAVENSDVDEYDKLEAKKGEIKPPTAVEEPPAEPEPENKMHPEVERWVSENEWFKKDEELQKYALYLGNTMADEKHDLATPGNEYEFGQEVKRRVMKAYPDKFKNPARNESDFDEPDVRGGAETHNTKTKGWNDLPNEAQAQFKKILSDIPNYTKEQYITDYFEEGV